MSRPASPTGCRRRRTGPCRAALGVGALAAFSAFAAGLDLTTFGADLGAPKATAFVSALHHDEMRAEGFSWSGFGVSARVGALAIVPAKSSAVIAPALADDGNFSAENVSIAAAGVTYAMNRIDVFGASIAPADLARLLEPNDPRPFAERLGALSAAAIVIPELTVTASGGARRSVYKGIELRGIGKGKAASAAAAGSIFSSEDPSAGETRGASGAIRVAGLDFLVLSQILSWAGAASGVSALLCESLAIEDVEAANAQQGALLRVRNFASGPVKTRPPPLQAPSTPRPPPGKTLANVLDIIETGVAEATEVRLRLAGQRSRPAASLSLERASGGFEARSGVASFEGQNATLETEGLNFTVRSISAEGVPLAAAAETLSPGASGAASSTSIHAALTDVAASWDRAAPDETGGKATASADRLALIWNAAREGLWRIDAALDHLRLRPADIASGPFPYLATLGYFSLDLSSHLDLSWSEASRELEVSSLSLSAAEAGAATIGASLENASKDLLSSNEQIASAAALGIVLRRLDLRLDNEGLFERALAADAKAQKKTVDQVRQGYLAAAATALPAVLGGGASARMLGSALAKFITRPESLRIAVKAPEGFGAIDLEDGPGRLLVNLEIEASANPQAHERSPVGR